MATGHRNYSSIRYPIRAIEMLMLYHRSPTTTLTEVSLSTVYGGTLVRTVFLPLTAPTPQPCFTPIQAPASTVTRISVLPASTKYITQTLSLAQIPAGPPAPGVTVVPAASWPNANSQTVAIQTRTVTTTSILSGAVAVSTAFLPAITLKQTVSLTLFRTVTAVFIQRQTLNRYVTSTLPQRTVTSTVSATSTLPQVTAYIGHTITEVRFVFL